MSNLLLTYTPLHERGHDDVYDMYEFFTNEDRIAWKKRRRALAATPGSEWVYFRKGDEFDEDGNPVGKVDPWSGCEIRIIGVRKHRRGTRYLAINITRDAMNKSRRIVPLARWVTYDDLH